MMFLNHHVVLFESVGVNHFVKLPYKFLFNHFGIYKPSRVLWISLGQSINHFCAQTNFYAPEIFQERLFQTKLKFIKAHDIFKCCAYLKSPLSICGVFKSIPIKTKMIISEVSQNALCIRFIFH